MKLALVACLAIAACGSSHGSSTAPSTSKLATPVATTVTDWMTALLPDGAQIVVEVDLARLRANAVVGEVAAKILGDLSGEQRIPGLPIAVQGSPLANADAIVLGAYGVGTAQATTLVVLATKDELEGAIALAKDLWVIGPEEWTGQVAARAAIAKLAPDRPVTLGGRLPVTLGDDLARLRDHAMPKGAPGATLRVTARLPFDARIALARITGLEAAPAQLSLWADIVDDFALVLDADAADPGTKDKKAARTEVATSLKALFTLLGREPSLRAIGVGNNIAGARFVEQGTWVRAIIEVGPRQLARAAERARAMLPPAS